LLDSSRDLCRLFGRRVLKLSREAVTLDRLSRGRLILGLGTGGDDGREYSAFGEDADPARLGRVLDDGVATLTSLWAGDPDIAVVTRRVPN